MSFEFSLSKFEWLEIIEIQLSQKNFTESMSRFERENPTENFDSSKKPKGKNIIVKISIPAAVAIAIFVYILKMNRNPTENFNVRTYLSVIDEVLIERLKGIPDSTSNDFINTKFVLDYKRMTIDPLGDLYLNEHWEELKSDLTRVANERYVTLPTSYQK